MWLMLRLEGISDSLRYVLLACLSVLASVEKLCSILNLVSVERDWVVVIADRSEAALRGMNSQMRRIDLICKLVGPFLISIFDGFSTILAIEVTFGMNVISVVIEYFAIKEVGGVSTMGDAKLTAFAGLQKNPCIAVSQAAQQRHSLVQTKLFYPT